MRIFLAILVTNYCQRVTADDGALAEQYLRDFQDNEKTIPGAATRTWPESSGFCVLTRRA